MMEAMPGGRILSNGLAKPRAAVKTMGMNRAWMAWALALGLAAAVGCESQPRPATTGPLATGSRDPVNPEARQIDVALSELSRHIAATRPVAANNPAAISVIDWTRFTNRAGASDQQFERFMGVLLEHLRTLGPRHQLVFDTEGARGGLSNYEMHGAVMPMPGGDDKWLVQLAVVGPTASGQRDRIWSDMLILPRP